MTHSAISPLDGRYFERTRALAPYFSERALMKYRVKMEGEYLIALSETKGLDLRKFSEQEKKMIRALYDLREIDAQIIFDIEFKGYKSIKATDHDVKAIEYFLKDKLARTSLHDALEWIHFALTSYDTNTIARGMMLGDALSEAMIPKISEIIQALDKLAKKYK